MLGRLTDASQITRFLRRLVIAVVVVPAILYTSAAWLNYRAAFYDGRESLGRANEAAEQQAQRIFSTDALILDVVADHTADMDWPEIARSEPLHRLLQRFVRGNPGTVIGLVAPDGKIVANSLMFPLTPTPVAKRGFLKIERPGAAPLYISTVSAVGMTREPRFELARVKPGSAVGPSGGGMIFVAMPGAEFINYYRTIVDPDDFSVTIARADGAVLVRYPGEKYAGRTLPPDSAFARATAREPERGTYDTIAELDGVRRLFAYHRVGSFPVYVNVGMSRWSVIAGWLRLMASHLIFGVPAVICLVVLTVVALRRSEVADRAAAAARHEEERRIAAEESLRHAQKMEAVGQLTGGVAHDFNNLLTAITGNLDLILRRPAEEARVRRLAGAALRATTRGERLTQQLLVFSRRQVMHPETLNLNRALIEFEGLMRRAAGERVELRLELDPALDPSHVDRAQLEAAVLNLVVNARDAMPDGGTILIETQNMTLDAAYAAANPEIVPGDYVMVAVSDAGTGIEPGVLPHIFEPFFTTKDIGRGSGLGLSQVYGFAKESRGHVKVYSEPGSGTTVRLFLTKSPEAANETGGPALNPLHSAGAGETVLVVEDDAEVLALAVESLGDLGYVVLTAENGAQALESLRGSARIDILFSDIVMPGGINGGELAAEARRLRPGIKVLLTSGYTAAVLRGDHRFPENTPVLGKPYRREQLAAQLRVIVGGQGKVG